MMVKNFNKRFASQKLFAINHFVILNDAIRQSRSEYYSLGHGLCEKKKNNTGTSAKDKGETIDISGGIILLVGRFRGW